MFAVTVAASRRGLYVCTVAERTASSRSPEPMAPYGIPFSWLEPSILDPPALLLT